LKAIAQLLTKQSVRVQMLSVFLLLFAKTRSLAWSLPAPTDLQVIRVGTGPSSKQTQKIFDEGFAVVSWASVEGAAYYILKSSAAPIFAKNKTITVKVPKCIDVFWHDSDGAFFDCSWYQV